MSGLASELQGREAPEAGGQGRCHKITREHNTTVIDSRLPTCQARIICQLSSAVQQLGGRGINGCQRLAVVGCGSSLENLW